MVRDPFQHGSPLHTITDRFIRPEGPRFLLLVAESQLLRLPEGEVRLGSAAGCDLVIRDATVSRLHCALRCQRGRVTVRDLGSKNGLRLQGVRVDSGEMAVGDTLRLGRAVLVLLDRDPTLGIGEGCLLPGLVGRSEPMQRLARTVRLLSASPLGVLVLGETGSGKELVARALHDLSSRAAGPFRPVNCSAIPRELIESELFGHEKGAFTGAQASRAGLFELASGGTLFLDEIGELPLEQQPKLLRVLETRRVRRLGAQEEVPVDVRVVAATHAPLDQAVATSRFRRDLLFRLDESTVRVPPLRERREDVPALVAHFCAELPERVPPPPPEVVQAIQSLPFEGNVRELRNLVRRAAVLGWAEVIQALAARTAPDPGGAGPAGAAADGPGGRYHELARSILQDALRRSGGNKTQAARLLGLPKSTFQDRLSRYGAEPPAADPG